MPPGVPVGLGCCPGTDGVGVLPIARALLPADTVLAVGDAPAQRATKVATATSEATTVAIAVIHAGPSSATLSLVPDFPAAIVPPPRSSHVIGVCIVLRPPHAPRNPRQGHDLCFDVRRVDGRDHDRALRVADRHGGRRLLAWPTPKADPIGPLGSRGDSRPVWAALGSIH